MTSVGTTNARPAFVADEDEDADDDDEDDETEYYNSFAATAHQKWFTEVTEPQKAGVELLNSGDFGKVANKSRTRRKDINLAKSIMNRSRHPQPTAYKEDHADVTSSLLLRECNY